MNYFVATRCAVRVCCVACRCACAWTARTSSLEPSISFQSTPTSATSMRCDAARKSSSTSKAQRSMC